ncbi:TLC domain-containing protein [Xylariaceae sp. FL0804]|nr:TLC domain-containing protein [Xylariaceae sp. FL0804]
MKDPFPIPPLPALTKAVRPWAEAVGLPTLPLHVHEVLLAAAFYSVVGRVLSPLLSRRLFPAQYGALSPSKRLNWDVHVVSLVQSTTINILALWVIFADDERRAMDWQERIWGYDGAAAMIQALAAGYFLFDLIVTASNVNVFGVGMLAHAVSALLVYSFGFRPFLNYYSCNFILWELSSPFLNIHWFFDKLNMTGSRAQLYNGLVLIATFFSCRLVWGTIQSFFVFRDVWAGLGARPATADTAVPTGDELSTALFPAQYAQTMGFVSSSTRLPVWLGAIYLASNMTLNSLNFYWFFKMIDAVRKRFDPKQKEKEAPISSKSRQVELQTLVGEKRELGTTESSSAATTGVDGGGAPALKTRPRRGTILDGEDADEPPPV